MSIVCGAPRILKHTSTYLISASNGCPGMETYYGRRLVLPGDPNRFRTVPSGGSATRAGCGSVDASCCVVDVALPERRRVTMPTSGGARAIGIGSRKRDAPKPKPIKIHAWQRWQHRRCLVSAAFICLFLGYIVFQCIQTILEYRFEVPFLGFLWFVEEIHGNPTIQRRPCQ